MSPHAAWLHDADPPAIEIDGPIDVCSRNRRAIVLFGDEPGRRRVRELLAEVHSVSCPPGNNFFAYLRRVTNKCGTGLADYAGVEPSGLLRVAGFFGSIQAGYAAGMNKTRWAAEVPGHDVGRIDLFFPSAQVLYAVDRTNHASDVGAARRAGARMPVGRFLEIGDEDLLVRPGETVTALLDFLGESSAGFTLRGVGAPLAGGDAEADDASR